MLVRATPRALAPLEARLLPRRVPALEAWVDLSRWEVAIRAEGVCAGQFERRVQELAAQGGIDFMRGDKPRHIGLANTLVGFDAQDVPGGIDLVLETRSSNQGALRPAVLVQAACGCAPVRVCRVGQWHECEDGTRMDPMG